jgi:hypothetical protein
MEMFLVLTWTIISNIDDLDKEDPPSMVQKFLEDENGKEYLKSSLVAGLGSNRSKNRRREHSEFKG